MKIYNQIRKKTAPPTKIFEDRKAKLLEESIDLELEDYFDEKEIEDEEEEEDYDD